MQYRYRTAPKPQKKLAGCSFEIKFGRYIKVVGYIFLLKIAFLFFKRNRERETSVITKCLSPFLKLSRQFFKSTGTVPVLFIPIGNDE
jgi:hypothetical protein